MTLTLSHGPLSGSPPDTVNYRLDGPEHRLLFEHFPRRVRAVLGDETVFDTTYGSLLHETGHLPVLNVPEQDLRSELLEESDAPPTARLRATPPIGRSEPVHA